MQLTTHTDYSLRLLIFLALTPEGETATVQDAAARYGISANHMAKVAQTLVQLGYIRSQRGRGGGLSLSHRAADITVGEVVRATENLQLLDCFGPSGTCPITPACRLKSLLGEACDAFLAVLDNCTLADLVDQPRTLRHLLGVVETR